MKTLPHSSMALLVRPALILGAISLSFTALRAADHSDSPATAGDPSADIGDVFVFLDPSDNTKVVVSMTVRGFIVPSEAVNLGFFDPSVRYQFQIEGNGDAVPDALINVSFSPRTSTTAPQTATVTMLQGASTVFNFTAPTTVPTLNATAPAQVVTTDSRTGVSFFGGEVDDPFFFDIAAFSRYFASALAGSPNIAFFSRARDSFARYNILAISLRIPKALLPSASTPQGASVVGVSAATFRTPNALANISTRADVEGGDKVLIAGSIISGNSPKRVIVRALGPTLTAFGVAGSLSDPTLQLYDSQGQLVASNDDWQSSQETEITNLGFAPSNPKESAIIATLQPGAYTAIVDGAGGAKGIALVEVYDLLGRMSQVDRMGIPAVNTFLIPFARKDEYNASTTQDDAAGRFATDIVATLRALGTDDTSIGILVSIAVTKGDILRLNLNLPNTGNSGGTNPEAAFPNGRRLGDDVIDTLVTLINNRKPVNPDGRVDNVDANDVPLRNAFPFFALSQQPRDTGVVDDNTRN